MLPAPLMLGLQIRTLWLRPRQRLVVDALAALFALTGATLGPSYEAKRPSQVSAKLPPQQRAELSHKMRLAIVLHGSCLGATADAGVVFLDQPICRALSSPEPLSHFV